MADVTLIPARMLNEVVYCPRLFALEWVHGEWADSADTVEGRTAHRRVDRETRRSLPEPEEGEEPPVVTRSVLLGDQGLGIIARIDVVETAEGRAVPVDTKKGRAPDVPDGAWPPERVQVCAQALLLRTHGYEVPHGELYFAGSRRRVRVELDEALVAETLAARDEARRLAARRDLPPPLVDSPRCIGCSLRGICLPDEVNHLRGEGSRVRSFSPPRDDALPLYVRQHGGKVGKDGGEIVVRSREGELGRARIRETSQVVLMGNVQVSTQLLAALSREDVPVAWHSYGGWYRGSFIPASGNGALLRIDQHAVARDERRALGLARQFVHAKIRNSRVLLRRNGEGVPDDVLHRLKELADDVKRTEALESLLGLEGSAARLYFGQFAAMLRGEAAERFEVKGRNRRPPRDPVNALLSFAYACLTRECTHVLHHTGLDPYVGFLHQPRPGKPALALDLMEELRPVVADSVVVTALNNGEVQPDDFVERTTGVALTRAGKKRFIRTWERRLDERVTHPVFGTRLSMRRVIAVQARLLARTLQGELDAYPEYRIR